MGLHARIVAVVAEAKSPKDALSAAIRVTAEAFAANGGVIFVRGPSQALQARAVFGDVEPSVMTTASALADKAISEMASARSTSFALALAAVPVARINRSIGAISLSRAASSEFTTEELMRLSGVASEVVELIESTSLIEMLERPEPPLSDHASVPPPSRDERILHGIAAAPGIAMGAAAFRYTFPRQLARRETISRDLQRLGRAGRGDEGRS